MIKPIGKKVAVVPEQVSEVTTSGLYIPDSAQSNVIRAKVIAVGLCDSIKVDDIILFHKNSGMPVSTDSVACILVNEDDVLGVFNAL